MGQSNVIAGALALAFLLYITVKGELPEYLNLFKYKKHVNPSTQSSDSGGGLFGNILGDLTGGSVGDIVSSITGGGDLTSSLTNAATNMFTPFHSMGTVTNVLQQFTGGSKQSLGASTPMTFDFGSYVNPSSLGFTGDVASAFGG